MRPKLVSNGRTSGNRTRQSSTDAIRIRQWYRRNRRRGRWLDHRRGRQLVSCGYTAASLDFRYLAIEGPIGLGKTALAQRLSARLDGTAVLDERANPFLASFYANRSGAAFHTQLFYTLARHRQQIALRQGDLFSQTTICDYLFDRDRIYAFMNLDDNELFIYQRLFDLLSRDLVPPDLVVYLQTPTDALKRRLKDRAKRAEDEEALPTDEYLAEL